MNWNKIIKRSIYSFLVLGLLGVIGVGAYSYMVIKKTPKVTKAKFQSKSTTRIYDANGKMIYRPSMQNRDYVKYKDIPEQYINAITSTEDKSFWTNPGFDFLSTSKAVAKQLIGKADAGGSTITQQLIKLSVYSTSSKYRTIDRKIQELWLSYQLSQIFTKEQILEMYVNKMFMGENVYGAQTISELYFGKKLSDLTLSQTAIIAGIGQSPSYYDLYSNPKAVSKRRGDVLAAMVNNHKITEKEAIDAMEHPVTEGLQPRGSFQKDDVTLTSSKDYIQSVINQLVAEGYDPYTQQLTVHTNLNQSVQKELMNTINDSKAYNDLKNKDIQAAGTIVNPNDGAIVAQVGGRGKSTQFGLNRATNKNRSSGSAIKPLVDYGPAIEKFGWSTDHIVQDISYTYPGTNIHLYDWDRQFPGNMTMKYALAMSRNVPAVKTLDQVGGSYAQAFLDKVGIKTKTPPAGSDAIGLNVSSEELAGAYSSVANGGIYHKQSYIKDIEVDGKKVEILDDEGTRVMKPSTAFLLTNMMQAVIQKNATAKDAIINGLTQAGKSGLVGYENDSNAPDKAISDAWMTGFTKPDKATNSGYSIAIWTGYDSPNKPNSYIPFDQQGLPEKLYKEIMEKISKGQKNGDWVVPSDVQKISGGNPINLNTHYRPTDSSSLPSPSTKIPVSDYSSLENYFIDGRSD